MSPSLFWSSLSLSLALNDLIADFGFSFYFLVLWIGVSRVFWFPGPGFPVLGVQVSFFWRPVGWALSFPFLPASWPGHPLQFWLFLLFLTRFCQPLCAFGRVPLLSWFGKTLGSPILRTLVFWTCYCPRLRVSSFFSGFAPYPCLGCSSPVGCPWRR